MRNFIKQISRINIFQLALIAGMGGIQFLINTYAVAIPDKVRAVVVIGALGLVVIAAGISGVVANMEGSYEIWEEKTRSSPKHKWLAFFVKGAYLVALGTIFLLNQSVLHTSPAVTMLVILGVLIIGNGIKYLRDTVF